METSQPFCAGTGKKNKVSWLVAGNENDDDKVAVYEETGMKKEWPTEPDPRPAFDTIVQGRKVVGDASWLLNFAVIGQPKCGTTTLMYQLAQHPEIQMFEQEVRHVLEYLCL